MPNEFSDHCPIWIGLDCQISHNTVDDFSFEMEGKFIWSPLSKDKFITTINNYHTASRLREFMANIDTNHFSDVNGIVEAFSNILLSAAKESVDFKRYKIKAKKF